MSGPTGSSQREENLEGVLIHFTVCEHHFALTASSVIEVVLVPELVSFPGPSILEGFMNIGGSVIPVLDCARLLNLESRSLELYDHVIRMASGYGLRVNSVEGVARIQDGEEHPVPPELSFNESLSRYLEFENFSLGVLNEQALLLELERQRMEEFTEMEKERLELL